MRMTITFLSFILITPAVWSQEVCQNYDYQEIKDMSAEDLTREYCKVAERLEKNAHWEAFQLKSAEGRIEMSRLSREMGNARQARENLDAAGRFASDANNHGLAKKACADQQERLLRVLASNVKKGEDSVPVCTKKG